MGLFMPDFQILEALTHFDYTQMRALEQRRATNEAMKTFVNLFNGFFNSAVERITLAIATQYVTFIQQISLKIDQDESVFFKEKYRFENPDFYDEVIDSMVKLNAIENKCQGIQRRMQFWAAGNSHGDTIRNVEAHIELVQHLNKWEEAARNLMS
jgi:hypothetical protein